MYLVLLSNGLIDYMAATWTSRILISGLNNLLLVFALWRPFTEVSRSLCAK